MMREGHPAEGPSTRAIDYDLGDAGATMLAAACLLPTDVRRDLIADFAKDHGKAAVVELFAQFIGLANAVSVGEREAIELFAIVEGGMSERQAEQFNLPTIFGAIMGDRLARKVDASGACAGCAFRRGSLANMSPSTTIDAEHCGSPGEEAFFCHEDLDDKGSPTRACVGWARLRAQEKAR